jgi:hypothetical protein
MDNEPSSNEQFNPYSDSPPPTPPRRGLGRLPRAAVAGGIAAVVALGAAGIAFAATSGSSSTPASGSSSSAATTPTTAPSTPNTPKVRGPGGPGRVGFRFGPGGFGAIGGLGGLGGGAIVHGTITTHTSSGYKTIEYQTGQVTSVSPSSITVKSADGYSDTYVVTSKTVVDSQAGGISSVKTGDQVSLEATPQSGKDTAVNIVDTTKVGSSRTSFGFPMPAKGGPAAPNGSSSGSSAGTSGFAGGPGQPQ